MLLLAGWLMLGGVGMALPLIMPLPLSMPLPTSSAPKYAIRCADGPRVRGELSYSLTCPQLLANHWVVAIADAPELPGQAKPKTELVPAGKWSKEKSPLQRSIWTAVIPAKSAEQRQSIAVQVRYEATLRSRKLVPLADDELTPMVPPLADAEKKRYLASLGDIEPTQKDFVAWMKAQGYMRQPHESDLDFARRVFLGLRGQLSYDYQPEMDRKASAVCVAGKSDCGGLSVLFVTLMRANQVPARVLYGRWAVSARPDEKLNGVAYYQWHVKAEFFAEGIGWVPVDLASGILHDKSKEGLQFFGNDRGDFLTFHVDPALSIDTKFFGVQTVGWLQLPAWWARGIGSVHPLQVREDWKVEVLK